MSAHACRLLGIDSRFIARARNLCASSCICLSRAVLTATAVVFLSASAAPAAVLDPPQLAVDVLFNLTPPGHISTNQFGTTSLSDPGLGAVSFTASGTPSPSLLANAVVGPSQIPRIFGRASGLLNYGLEIVGPAGPVPVLIDVAGSASALALSGASFAVESRWNLLDFGAPLAGDDIRSGQLGGTFNQAFSHTVSLTLSANHIYTLFMLADAAAAATLEGSRATATALIDPVFSFGSGVDPVSYRFVFSEGIGNSAPPVAVPEPGMVALLSAGLLNLVFLRRRRPHSADR